MHAIYLNNTRFIGMDKRERDKELMITNLSGALVGALHMRVTHLRATCAGFCLLCVTMHSILDLKHLTKLPTTLRVRVVFSEILPLQLTFVF
jgi:hypothetical protein